jgi:hypothetical protein
MYRSERILDESGITVAPPHRLATINSLPAPSTHLSQHTRQRRPDPPADTETTCKDPKKTNSEETDASTETILNFLETVYPTEESHPDYICIDKACLVLCTAISNGSWDANWKNTSRFIVDAYHYTNHRTTDYLCHKWCNPAPQDGSAPNLVVVSTDNRGQLYLKPAFNTQACEQLNAWLGGFESILKRMTPSNFNWFLLWKSTTRETKAHRFGLTSGGRGGKWIGVQT